MEFNLSKRIPQSNASPDLSNLTPEELKQLQKVFEKQEKFEKELQSSIKYDFKIELFTFANNKQITSDFSIIFTSSLQNKIHFLEKKDSNNQAEKSELKTYKSNISLTPTASSKLCFICKRAVGSISSETFFVRNETMQCHTCLRLACERCGSLRNPVSSVDHNRNIKNVK